MLTALDHVVIAVRDLEVATSRYGELLGLGPSWAGEHPDLGTRNTLYRLGNTYLELLSPIESASGLGARWLEGHFDRHGEGLAALAFATDDVAAARPALEASGIDTADPEPGQGVHAHSKGGAEGERVRRWTNLRLSPKASRGVVVFLIEHRSPPEALPPAPFEAERGAAVAALDHVVIHSADPEATRAFYGDALGLRLALDREFPRFGTRLLFFRVAGITVEVGARLDAEPEPDTPDRFGGLAYQVPDLSAAHARLETAGFDVSEVREGRKPGTRVCTVRAETCGVPTLLIEPGDGR